MKMNWKVYSHAKLTTAIEIENSDLADFYLDLTKWLIKHFTCNYYKEVKGYRGILKTTD